MAAHCRGDDPAGAAAFWDRDLGWGAEYRRYAWLDSAHHQGPGRVSLWQIAAALSPAVLRDALILRLDRRLP